MRQFFAAFALILAVGSPASATDVTRAIKVDSEFQNADITYNNAFAGGYEALIAIKAHKGYLELCGVGKVTNAQANVPIRKALLNGRLKVNNKVVLKNFTYFARAKRSLKSTAANCARTSHKTSVKVNSIDFRYGSASFTN